MTDDRSRSRGRPPGADGRPGAGGAPDAAPPDGVVLRRATPDDAAGVLRVIEGALLAVDAGRVRERIDAGAVLVAATGRGTVVGALVRDGDRLVAVAVSRRRRRQGIGRALVERALGATGRLTAAFDPRVRGFYEALGFAVRGEPPGGTAEEGAADGPRRRDDGRLWGVRTG